jgi:hypothetical protein
MDFRLMTASRMIDRYTGGQVDIQADRHVSRVIERYPSLSTGRHANREGSIPWLTDRHLGLQKDIRLKDSVSEDRYLG